MFLSTSYWFAGLAINMLLYNDEMANIVKSVSLSAIFIIIFPLLYAPEKFYEISLKKLKIVYFISLVINIVLSVISITIDAVTNYTTIALWLFSSFQALYYCFRYQRHYESVKSK